MPFLGLVERIKTFHTKKADSRGMIRELSYNSSFISLRDKLMKCEKAQK